MERSQVILHYLYQGYHEYATDPRYGKKLICRLQIYVTKW